MEIWQASEQLPGALLSLLPEPVASRQTDDMARRIDASLEWLSEHYWDQPFWMERDVVWTLQKRLKDDPEAAGGPVQVVHNFRTAFGHVDLAVLLDDMPRVLIECKYEPARQRPDFVSGRLGQAVVFWDRDGVLEDIRRVTRAVASGDAPVAYAVFFDEGGRFRHRASPPISTWLDWRSGNAHVSVLLTRVDRTNVRAARDWLAADAVPAGGDTRRAGLSPSEIASALEPLAGRDREVIEKRLAGATQAEIARQLSLSTSRVAQIEKRAKQHLGELGVLPDDLGLPSGGGGRPPRRS